MGLECAVLTAGGLTARPGRVEAYFDAIYTGVHLHFQVWVDGEPTDPQQFLGNRSRLRG